MKGPVLAIALAAMALCGVTGAAADHHGSPADRYVEIRHCTVHQGKSIDAVEVANGNGSNSSTSMSRRERSTATS